MRRLLSILIVCALVSMPVAGSGAAQRRVALVIGNGAYQNAPLRNPVHDAADIGRALKRLGFQVTVLRDAGQRKMEDAIRAFGRRLSKGGVGLFYYAGHGMQVEGRNYLIPVDARIEDPSDVKFEALDAGRVLGKMEVAANAMNIVILDACRDNPFSRSWRSGHRGLARMDAPKGSLIAYATAPGSVAADGDGRNGVYTAKLLKYMDVPGLEIGKLFREVRVEVVRESANKQTPWESSSLMGEFYFNPGKTAPAASQRAVGIRERKTPRNLNAEEELWNIVKTSAVIEDYQMFLDEFPDSRFSAHARLRMQQLKRKQHAKQMTAAIPADSKAPERSSGGEVVAEDGHLVKYSSGIVYDKKTKLEWFVGPDKNINWKAAQKWAAGIKVGGGGWRLPNAEELQSIHNQKAEGDKKLSPLLATTGSWVWLSYAHLTQGFWQRAGYFGGKFKVKQYYDSDSNYKRAFAVRRKK